MTSNELITRKNIELALLNKGQHSRRYKLGDIWELDYYEIREVLDDVDADIKPVVHCPECRYFDPDGWCEYLDTVMYKNDFCSRGKRKGADNV